MLEVEVYGCELRLQGSPLTLLVYEEEFGQELTQALAEAYESKDFVPLGAQMRFLWALCKTADNSIPHFEEWLRAFPGDAFTLAGGTLGVINSAIHAELFRGPKTTWELLRWRLSEALERLAKRIRP